jgi:hypothetical protein
MKVFTSLEGCTRMGRIRNDKIQRELGIYSIEDKMKEYKARWLEHMHRMDDTRIPEEAFHYRLSRRRDICHLRKRQKAEA